MQKSIFGMGRAAVVLALSLLAFLSGAAKASDVHGHPIQIAVADDTATTKLIVAALLRRYPSAQVSTESNKYSSKKRAIYITVGPSALRVLLAQEVDGVIVSTFTSSQAYRAILESMPGPRAAAITAVYAEPSPAVQFRLIAMLYKKPVGVAAIVSDKTSYLEPILQRAASQSGAVLSVENFAAGDSLNRVLKRLTDIPVILATPDSTVYNAENFRNILVTAYRRNQAVVGFSAALVKAGALASSYSDIEDINAQVDELIADFEASGKLPEPQFPKYFSVLVNEDVARSLNIVVDDFTRKFSHKPGARQP